MLVDVIVHDGEPDFPEIFSAGFRLAIIKAVHDMDAVAEAADALEQDGKTGSAGNFCQNERAAWELVGATGVGHGDWRDCANDTVALDGDGLAGSEDAAELHTEMVVGLAVVNFEEGIVLFCAAEFGLP